MTRWLCNCGSEAQVDADLEVQPHSTPEGRLCGMTRTFISFESLILYTLPDQAA